MSKLQGVSKSTNVLLFLYEYNSALDLDCFYQGDNRQKEDHWTLVKQKNPCFEAQQRDY
jgi:hypothetical protein